MLNTLKDAAVQAWRHCLATAQDNTSGSMADDHTFAVGHYQGLRDAYLMVGGSWADLSEALAAAELPHAAVLVTP